MIIHSLKVKDYRNMKDGFIEPSDGMNVLYGENAHGKTNLLEAVWLMTGGKSFRGSRDKDLIRFSCEKADITMEFRAGGRCQTATVSIEGRRKAILNGIPQATPKRLTGHFCAVIFSPDHLSLIKDGPEERRRFIDAACCQLRPGFMKVFSEYNRLIKQRNQWIKAVKNGEQASDELLMDALDERMAKAGAAVRRYRTAYIQALSPFVSHLYNGLSRGREQMDILYSPPTSEEIMRQELAKARHIDQKAGFTTVGPHRDDIEILIDGTCARLFGSQGQQRSAVLALKLAEAALLADGYGEKPVILLDDVMSELDSSRQEYILNHINGYQVFITCCDPATVTRLTDGKVFHIQNGEITAHTTV